MVSRVYKSLEITTTTVYDEIGEQATVVVSNNCQLWASTVGLELKDKVPLDAVRSCFGLTEPVTDIECSVRMCCCVPGRVYALY